MVLEDLIITREHFEILQPTIMVCRIFGLLPIQYAKQGSYYKLKRCLIYEIYSYCLTIALTIGTLLGVINDLKRDNEHSIRMQDKKTRIITSCDISIVIIIVLFSSVTTTVKLRNIWELLTCLNQVDLVVPLVKHAKIRQSSIAFMTKVFGVVIFIFCFDLTVWTVTTMKRMRDSTLFLRNYFTFYVSYLLVVIQGVLFCHLVLFVNVRIGSLNESLSHFGSDRFDATFRKVPLRQGQKWKGQLVPSLILSNSDELSRNKRFDTSLVGKINSLMMIQGKIHDAVQSINSCHSYAIHLIMLSCLLHLIVTPYFLLIEVIKPDGSLLFIYLQTVWFLAHIGRVLIMVESCQDCLNQHRKTSSLLCELLTRDFDENTKNTLSLFLLQLDCCKIKFTSCDFFTIDRSLATSVSAAVTTYLVILFQFSNMDES